MSEKGVLGTFPFPAPGLKGSFQTYRSMFLPGGSGTAPVQDLSNSKLVEVHRRILTDFSEL